MEALGKTTRNSKNNIERNKTKNRTFLKFDVSRGVLVLALLCSSRSLLCTNDRRNGMNKNPMSDGWMGRLGVVSLNHKLSPPRCALFGCPFARNGPAEWRNCLPIFQFNILQHSFIVRSHLNEQVFNQLNNGRWGPILERRFLNLNSHQLSVESDALFHDWAEPLGKPANAQFTFADNFQIRFIVNSITNLKTQNKWN